VTGLPRERHPGLRRLPGHAALEHRRHPARRCLHRRHAVESRHALPADHDADRAVFAGLGLLPPARSRERQHASGERSPRGQFRSAVAKLLGDGSNVPRPRSPAAPRVPPAPARLPAVRPVHLDLRIGRDSGRPHPAGQPRECTARQQLGGFRGDMGRLGRGTRHRGVRSVRQREQRCVHTLADRHAAQGPGVLRPARRALWILLSGHRRRWKSRTRTQRARHRDAGLHQQPASSARPASQRNHR